MTCEIVTLSTGRRVTRERVGDTSMAVVLDDGDCLTQAEWDEYCARLSDLLARQARAARPARHKQSAAAFRRGLERRASPDPHLEQQL
jgi:hypothetical protein